MSRPTVTVKNNASYDIFVSGDPNWDDQILLVNGEPIDRPYPLTPGSSIKVSVDWDGAGA